MTRRTTTTARASAEALSNFDDTLPLDILYILGPDSPSGWLAHALAAEQGEDGFRVAEVESLGLALEQLRAAPYHVVVLDDDAPDCAPPAVLPAIASVTHEDQAVLVFSAGHSRARASDFLRHGMTSYISLPTTHPSELVCQLQAAARRDREATELHRLRAWHAQHEQHEQERNLEHVRAQASLISSYQDDLAPTGELDVHRRSHRNSNPREHLTCEDSLVDECRDLIRTYVLMGRGDLRAEIDRFVKHHRDRGASARVMALHVTRVIHELIRSRGKRSSSHVLHRGNQLLLDLLLTWSDAVETEERHETLGHHSDS